MFPFLVHVRDGRVRRRGRAPIGVHRGSRCSGPRVIWYSAWTLASGRFYSALRLDLFEGLLHRSVLLVDMLLAM